MAEAEVPTTLALAPMGVGTSASAKGGYPIGWGRYCKYCVPATIIVMAVSTAYLFLRYL